MVRHLVYCNVSKHLIYHEDLINLLRETNFCDSKQYCCI